MSGVLNDNGNLGIVAPGVKEDFSANPEILLLDHVLTRAQPTEYLELHEFPLRNIESAW